ncbi:MAG: ribosome maturation factor RimM [Alphaproteobacteria bacterium]|nr:ribosome maturation factor RimM [Alphaproteobacteria bacterium]
MTGTKVCLGVIAGPHGVKGLVRVRSYTDRPADIVAYGPLTDQSGGRPFELEIVGTGPKGQLLGRLAGVADRDAADALKGQALYIDRDRLPEPGEADTYYHADLVGLAAQLADGAPFGTVRAVHDFGAGEVLELAIAGPNTLMLPFTKAAVPVVDIAAGRIVVDPPAGLLPGVADETEGKDGS